MIGAAGAVAAPVVVAVSMIASVVVSLGAVRVAIITYNGAAIVGGADLLGRS